MVTREVLRYFSAGTLLYLFQLSQGITSYRKVFEVISPKQWGEGVTACTSRNMEFAIIKDNPTMAEAINDSGDEAVKGIVWIGLRWNPFDHNFMWIDDAKMDYNYWEKDEPNCLYEYFSCEGGYQHCVSIFIYREDAKSMWRTRSCSETYNVLCMYDFTPTMNNLSSFGIMTQQTSQAIDVKSTTDEGTSRTETSMNEIFHSLSTRDYLIKSHSPSMETSNSRDYEMSTAHERTTQSQTNIETRDVSKSTDKPTSPDNSTRNTNASSPVSPTCQGKCNCTFQYATHHRNYTMPEAEYIYKINTKRTSAYIRRLTSAEDQRLSAKVLGCSGASVIIAICLSILCLDASRFGMHRKSMKV